LFARREIAYFANKTTYLQFPYTSHIGNIPILWHGLFEFLGIFIAFRYYLFLKKKSGDIIEQFNRLYVIIGATLGAVIGSRILGAFEDVPRWISAPSFWLYLYGNKTLVGGLLGGLAGVEIIKKLIGERNKTGDLFVFPLLLGMIIGRIGCFSAGVYEETYGLPTSLPWAMDLGDGICRHPVTLYEIAFLMSLWLTLFIIKNKNSLADGALFKIFLVSYLCFRFFLDFIKPGWRYFLNLGTIQLACIAGILYFVRYIVNPRLLKSTE
jgi:phosphatidylglycerol---prolipoprotein diacylglyceryl transferase